MNNTTASFRALSSTVSREEVLAALQIALEGPAIRGWPFNAVAPVGAVVVAKAPMPWGDTLEVPGVVVANRRDPVSGRTAAVVVSRFGHLYVTRVTESPGTGNTCRVTEQDVRETLASVKAQ